MLTQTLSFFYEKWFNAYPTVVQYCVDIHHAVISIMEGSPVCYEMSSQGIIYSLHNISFVHRNATVADWQENLHEDSSQSENIFIHIHFYHDHSQDVVTNNGSVHDVWL